jgi:hypothetical protein
VGLIKFYSKKGSSSRRKSESLSQRKDDWKVLNTDPSRTSFHISNSLWIFYRVGSLLR